MEGLTVLEKIGVFFATMVFFLLVMGTFVGIAWAGWEELKRASGVKEGDPILEDLLFSKESKDGH